MKEKRSSNRKLSIAEIVLYSISGALGLWGFVYVVLGVAAKYVKSDTDLGKFAIHFKDTFSLSVLYWGMIIMGIAAIFASIILLTNAKKSDREAEKQNRRAARLAGLSEKKAEEEKVIDVKATEPATPVEEASKAEEPKQEPVSEETPIKEEASEPSQEENKE